PGTAWDRIGGQDRRVQGGHGSPFRPDGGRNEAAAAAKPPPGEGDRGAPRPGRLTDARVYFRPPRSRGRGQAPPGPRRLWEDRSGLVPRGLAWKRQRGPGGTAADLLAGGG